MRLLVITQKVDKKDPVLGFFHGWINAFSKHFQSIVAICLQKGEYQLPNNVNVFSLGKEVGVSRLKYLNNFYSYIWRERKNYDAVFVHMNQEYIILGGWLWRMMGKKVYMWRNHYAGNLLTDFASFFCTKIFCTSRFSYTAKYKKTVFMPVGVDTETFKKIEGIERIPNSILSLGRISPSKKIDVLIEVLGRLNTNGVQFTASIYGDPLPKDKDYYEYLKKLTEKYNIINQVVFHEGIPNIQTPEVYSTHEIFINLSPSGMFDKTMFEAMGCGAILMTTSLDLKEKIDDRLLLDITNPDDFSQKLKSILYLSPSEKQKIIKSQKELSITHSLQNLGHKLFFELSK